MDNTVFWLWLQNAFGEGSGVPWHIYQSYPGGLEGFYRAGAGGWRALDYITPRHMEALTAFPPQAALARLEYALRLGWGVLTPESEKYPPGLRNISDPPAVLYTQGDLSLLSGKPWVAVAGARKAGEAGLAAARELGQGLSSAGAVVVSGMAPGADNAAIEGALMAGGRTVTVMPVDLSSPYQAKNAALRRRQLRMGGALLSEYFSQRTPAQGGFHLRNRLITGMCQAVVLVQVGEKSGSMIYARHAAKQGRRLFVYPGPPGDPAYTGSRRLLAEGAAPIARGWELFEQWPQLFGVSPASPPAQGEPPQPAPFPGHRPEKNRPAPQGPPAAFPPRPPRTRGEAVLQDAGVPAATGSREEQVLAALENQSRTVEELADATGMPAGTLLTLLARMELAGQVEQGPGRRYARAGSREY